MPIHCCGEYDDYLFFCMLINASGCLLVIATPLFFDKISMMILLSKQRYQERFINTIMNIICMAINETLIHVHERVSVNPAFSWQYLFFLHQTIFYNVSIFLQEWNELIEQLHKELIYLIIYHNLENIWFRLVNLQQSQFHGVFSNLWLLPVYWVNKILFILI